MSRVRRALRHVPARSASNVKPGLPDTQFELVVRISAHVYNHVGQYERLASVLSGFAGADRPGA